MWVYETAGRYFYSEKEKQSEAADELMGQVKDSALSEITKMHVLTGMKYREEQNIFDKADDGE